MKTILENWKKVLKEYEEIPSELEFASDIRRDEQTKKLQSLVMEIAPQVVERIIASGVGGINDSEDFTADLAHAAEGGDLEALCEWLLLQFGVDTSDIDAEEE